MSTAPAAGSIVGLLLAAGGGQRMGTPKAFIELGGRPAIQRATQMLIDGGATDLIVVCGSNGERARSLVRQVSPYATVVLNRRWKEGMSTSLRLGLQTAAALRLPNPDRSRVVVHLVDLPDVHGRLIHRLVTTSMNEHDDAIAAWVPTYGGRRGNPVVFAHESCPDIADSASGDSGARAWLEENSARVRLVECGDLASGHDLDTPEELTAWRRSPEGASGR